MNGRNAIIAVVVIIVIIAAAAGAFLLMNPGTQSSTEQGGGGSNDIRPSGPEGSVNSALITIAGTNDTNASALSELREWFNASANNVSRPDAMAIVAVTNNRTSDVTLNCSNFTATLENGNTVNASNDNAENCSVNATIFVVLGFVTNGTNITGIKYDDGHGISFSVSWTRRAMKSLPEPVFKEAPNATLSPINNTTFQSLQAWKISKGGNSPMALQFKNQSVVLVLMSVTNNNTSALNLKGSDFWLDLGNGTWVQGDDKLNNNIPATVKVNTTVPFLVGFRGVGNSTPTAVVYEPGNGTNGMMIPIEVNQSPPQGPFVVLKRIWDRNATNNNTTTTMVQVWVVGNGANGVDLSGMKAWTLKEGEIAPTEVQSNDSNATANLKQVTLVFELKKGDDLTLLSYESGGMTKYVWLRPVLTMS